MFRKILALILCAGLSAVLPLCAQDVLRVDVSLVNVFLTVQNQRGEYVQGLDASDFHVYEDDAEQKISVFEKDDKVQSSIGILMDTSGSSVDILPIIKTGVLDFAQKAKHADEFFVMTFGITAQVLLDINKPVQNLNSAFKTLIERGNCVLFDALLSGINKVSKREPQRKALIVFTDGNDNGSKAGFGTVRQAVEQTGVLLYFVPIGPKVHVDQPTVEDLAKLSGGRVVYLEKTDPIRPAMESIRTELAKQYYLGYYTSRRPGLHHIRVELPGHDVRIRTKTSYTGN